MSSERREGAAPAPAGADANAAEWIAAHVARLEPLLTAANLAGWEAATTGSDEALQRSADARTEVKRLYSDAGAAEEVRGLLAAGVSDPLLRRQLTRLSLDYAAHQLPEETIRDLSQRESELERVFYTFRGSLDGREVSNNELLDVLRTERDVARRRAAWEAGKAIGREIAEPLRELVRRRNAAARSLGFASYYSMQLQLEEIDEAELWALLDGFQRESEAPFAQLRAEIDALLAARHGVTTEALRPWHWEDLFGQEAPSVGVVDLDPVFRDRDLVAIARDYFRAIDLPVDDVLERSDLLEREGKDQHAFCTDIDRRGDVRVLCNLRSNEKWMGTLLHELGHAAYDRHLPGSLPYLLRTPAHTLSTEAVAMLMGRLTRDPRWLRHAAGAGLDDAEAADVRRQLRASMLIAARWILVMARFERELYRDPDRPDLNSLWWGLVEEIQLVRRPDGRDEPDWASKLHLSLAPVYYHNYLLGELMASQLDAALRQRLAPGEDEIGNPAAGRFLRGSLFSRGATLPWNELLAEATGAKLSPGYFVRQFVDG